MMEEEKVYDLLIGTFSTDPLGLHFGEERLEVTNLVTEASFSVKHPNFLFNEAFHVIEGLVGIIARDAGLLLLKLRGRVGEVRRTCVGEERTDGRVLAGCVLKYPLVALYKEKPTPTRKEKNHLEVWNLETDSLLHSFPWKEEVGYFNLLYTQGYLLLRRQDRVVGWKVTAEGIFESQKPSFLNVTTNHRILASEEGYVLSFRTGISFWKFEPQEKVREITFCDERLKVIVPSSYLPGLGIVSLLNGIARIQRKEEKEAYFVDEKVREQVSFPKVINYSPELGEVFISGLSSTAAVIVGKEGEGRVRKLPYPINLLLPAATKFKRKVLRCVLVRTLTSLPQVLVGEVFGFF